MFIQLKLLWSDCSQAKMMLYAVSSSMFLEDFNKTTAKAKRKASEEEEDISRFINIKNIILRYL